MRFLPLLLLAGCLAGQDKPVIGIGGIIHETNTFNPRKTTIEDFATGLGGAGILRGDEIVKAMEKGDSTLTGFIQGAKEFGLALHPTISAGPQTIGTVTDEAFDALTSELIDRLKAAPKLDGILLFLHGTMVAESHSHADAEVVRRVRKAFGDRMPIAVTHDFHANVSDEIVELSTILVTYKENPHLDARERGLQAARLLARTIRGEIRPTQAIARPPMIYNIVFQNTFQGPIKPVVDESKRLETQPKVLAASVPGGYQWADIPAMGPAAIVITDNDPALAKREAQRLADMLWATRSQLRLDLPDPAAAVRMAMSAAKHPVTLMDTGDNIGGGSSGDSTFILAELVRQKAEGWVVALADGEATEAAFRAGVGGAFDMPVGGKTDTMHGQPVRIRGRVKVLTDGRFVEPEVRHGGIRYWDMGPTAVIEAEGSTPDLGSYLILTKKRIIPFSLGQLTSGGIDPKRQKILVAKGTVAPRAAYEPVSAQIIVVDSGGVTAVNPARFTFRRVREGLFGMERPEKR
ncbi:MAG: M81 family metallopeptidase [Bryobacterales bacterium]|nr:M81 family metallopeptidase [Bryobacterales bacterium]